MASVLRLGRVVCQCGFATRLVVVPADLVSIPCPRCAEPVAVQPEAR
jgi:hypothetical protein